MQKTFYEEQFCGETFCKCSVHRPVYLNLAEEREAMYSVSVQSGRQLQTSVSKVSRRREKLRLPHGLHIVDTDSRQNSQFVEYSQICRKREV